MISIKRSLNLQQALLQVLVFTVFSILIYRFVEERLIQEFDKGLETLAAVGTGTVEIEQERGKIEIEIEDDHIPAYDKKSTLFLLSDPRDKVRLNPNRTDLTGWTLPLKPESGSIIGETYLPDGRPARFVGLRFMPEIEGRVDYKEGEWTVTVVREAHSINETLSILLWGCIGLGSIATILTLTASYLSIRRGLRPLQNMSEQVNALEAHNLNHRFDTSQLPSELQPISTKLNELLERMQTAFEREQRFTSNAAHELRTPLAELQAILQVGKNWSAEDLATDHPKNYFADGVNVTKRMSRLLETLFTLSRESQEAVEAEKVEFSLNSTLQRVTLNHEARSRILLPPTGPIILLANEDILIAAFTNLLNNASSHSTGEILVTIDSQNDTISLSVSNAAPDLSKEDLLYIREPFWRKEQSRSDQSHLGLGLNLVEHFCQSQKWQLELSLEGETFSATVSGIQKMG